MKQTKANVTIILKTSYVPEDFGHDPHNCPRTTLMDYVDVEVDQVIKKIAEVSDLFADEIIIEIVDRKSVMK